LYSEEYAKKQGIELKYVNTSKMPDPVAGLREVSGGTGFNDVFVFAPVAPVVEQADGILGFDGCLNFFAGPSDPDFKATLNFYNVHYAFTHIVGTSGGNMDDMKEALQIMSKGLDPAGLVTHIGGINAVIDTTLDLPNIPGGKKLIYNHIEMPLTAINDFAGLGQKNPVYKKLAEICESNNGLWSVEAENVLLENADNMNY
jgi:threonine dehydrogenase-like Zn-dependent dehydrogenase